MKNSRLFQLLQTLSKKEISEFKKFVRSPFFNHRQDVIQLYECLIVYVKKGKPAPEKKEVYIELFPTEKFDDHRVRLLISTLSQLVCKYLTIRDYKEDEIAFDMRLASILRKRNLSGHFIQAWNSLSEKHEKQPLRNARFFQRKYNYSLEKYQSEYNKKNVESSYLQGMSDQLDTSFIIQKLAHTCFLISHQTVSNSTYDFGLLEKVLLQIEQTDLLKTPAVAVYYYCYKALTHPNEKAYFQQFKEMTLQNDALFDAKELRDLYVLAINICIRRYNAGNSDYLVDQLDFYRDGLEKEYLLVAGWLSRYTYQNVVTIGLIMEEYEWVENFIHQYRSYLQEPYRESVFSFNLASLEYQRKHFDKSLQLLQKAEYKDLLLNLAAKTLQMKIFYENGDYDLLDSHLKAIKTFIRRKNTLGYHRDNYLNTIRLTRKLLELNPFDKAAKTNLRKEIESTKGLGEKEWLLEQV